MNPHLLRGATAIFVLGYIVCRGAYAEACDPNSKALHFGAADPISLTRI
jgi:hypothetical protein